ncbi:MAG: FecR domain-containing protein [Pirellulales bacterium]|nr:FecR domain-containing protein [Pirellulales bacterium]
MNGAVDEMTDRIHCLSIRQLDGVLSDDERTELTGLLREDAQARRVYLEHMQDTVSLRWMYSGHYDRRVAMTLAEHGPEGVRKIRRHRLAWGALAVAASLACVFTFNYPWAQDSAEKTTVAIAAPPAAAPAGVATVHALSDVSWVKGAKPAALLSSVQVDQEFEFSKGTVELVFHTGADVKIFGPAKFTVQSDMSILCSRGRVNTLVGESGKGFTIDTPKARIVDLGTQFGVDISATGDTQVVVFQGSVDLEKSAADAAKSTSAEKWTRRLQQGDAMRMDDSGNAQRVMAVQRGDFFPASNLDPYGRPRQEPVILDVSDNIRAGESTKCYQIVRGLREDAPCFVDRSHQWNGRDAAGIPEFLLGADYIMPFNDDKFISDLKVDVTIARPSTLYIFIDDNMPVPQWLRKDFKDTGVDIGLDGATTVWHKDHAIGAGPGTSIDFPFSIWSRELPKAGKVSLGGVQPPKANPRSQGFNMYGIAVVPK